MTNSSIKQLFHLLKFEAAEAGYKISSTAGIQKEYARWLYQYDDSISEIEDVQLDEKVEEFKLNQEDIIGYVLLPMIQPSTTPLLMSHMFRTRGYKPIILRCYSDIPHCRRQRQDKYDEIRCSTCIYAGDELTTMLDLESVYIHDILPDDYTLPQIKEYSKDIQYKDVDISQYAISSTRGYFKKYSIDFKNNKEKKIYEGFVDAALKLVDVSNRIFDIYDIDAVFGGDVTYIYDGILLDVAAQNSIPAASMGGKRKNKITIGFQSHRAPLPSYIDIETAREYINTELTKQQVLKIEKIMADRQKEENVGILTHADSDVTPPKQNSNMTYGLFSNLLWDASLVPDEDDILFSDPFNWVKKTVDIISESDSSLIIKTHPAEIIYGTEESVYQWAINEFGSLSNVEILKPDTKISPYELAKSIDAGIVYSSTIGLEMAFEGIPTILASKSHYGDLGFTFDPNSIEEYQSMILKNNLKMTDDMRKKAKRYAYLYFVRRHIDWNIDKTSINHHEVKPSNENIDKIIESILNKNPIIGDFE